MAYPAAQRGVVKQGTKESARRARDSGRSPVLAGFWGRAAEDLAGREAESAVARAS
jgi:hypothetical protein